MSTAPTDDRQAILSIVNEMATSMTGAQSTRHWAPNALWFDIPAFASKGDAMPVVWTGEHPGIEQFPAHAQVRAAMRASGVVNVDLAAAAYDQ